MPVIAIIGRPNVGKSTLFNRLGRRNQALIDDLPGVTRDRNYCRVEWDGKALTFIDTGGYIDKEGTNIEEKTREQILVALEEADLVLFVVDAKSGLHPDDWVLLDMLRRASKPFLLSANKIDNAEQNRNMSEFYELGVDRIYPISATHGFGIGELLTEIAETASEPEQEGEEEEPDEIRIAIVGRPNVGKSTLVNKILGEQRSIVSPVPGTTRDPVDTPFELHGQKYVLVDTAGIRKKGKTHEKIEKLSIMRALQSIEKCHVGILLVDAIEGITDQDLHVAGYIQDRSRGCIVGLNKWDSVQMDAKRTKAFMLDVKDRLRFLPFAPILTISAATGLRVSRILPTVREVFSQYGSRITTGVLNRAMQQALQRHEPPSAGGRRLKFFYATQASTRPPTFVLFCNYPEMIHFSYERYLINQFREAFNLDKTPIKLVFRARQRRE